MRRDWDEIVSTHIILVYSGAAGEENSLPAAPILIASASDRILLSVQKILSLAVSLYTSIICVEIGMK